MAVSSVSRLLLAFLALAVSAVSGAGDAPASASSRPQVGLNHFYVVLDEQTFAALRDSRFFREQFAVVDTGMPKFGAPDASSPRFYARGRTTYLEFLGPRNPFDEPVGKIGIALGVDRVADLDGVQRIWSERLDGSVDRTHVQWTKTTPPVPWYDAIQRDITSSNPHTVLWAAAYMPEFLPWLYPQRSARENGVARADFLAPRFAPDRLLEDVTGLVIALPAQLRAQIARQLEVLGYQRIESADALILQGHGWKLTLVEATQAGSGLRAVEFSTNRPKEGLSVIGIGPGSVIVFGPGRVATWCLL